ncbi:hypothetical protein GCM10020358_84970 [Amorphoplanes nipponensis]
MTEGKVAQADVGEALQDRVGGRGAGLAGAEELGGLGDRHGEDLADVAAAEVVLEHGGLESLALALFAGGGYAGHHGQVV